MSETIFSLEEIAEAFKYIQDDKLSTDAKAMLTMDIGYEKAEKDIIKLLEIGGPIEQIICDYWGDPEFDKDDALVLIEKAIKGEK